MASQQKLGRIHDTMHATHKPGSGSPLGAVRVERGLARRPDGTVDETRTEWKVYQKRELTQQDREMYTARLAVAEGVEAGDQMIEDQWYFVSAHPGEEEALAAARKLGAG